MTQHVSEAASKIIGSLNPAKGVSSSTGTPHGETGSAVSTPLPAIDLAALSDHEANKTVAGWLPPYVQLRPVYGPSLNNHTPIAYRAAPAGVDTAVAWSILTQILAPADAATVERALTELSLLTKARAEDDQTGQMRAALYMGKLSEYPADAVTAVCRSWANENVFWPSWSELRERLEDRVSQRRLMLEAVSG